MRGVEFIFDKSGRRKAVVLDLRKQGRLWEDFYDRVLAEQRALEPRESLDQVKKKLLRKSKKRGHG